MNTGHWCKCLHLARRKRCAVHAARLRACCGGGALLSQLNTRPSNTGSHVTQTTAQSEALLSLYVCRQVQNDAAQSSGCFGTNGLAHFF